MSDFKVSIPEDCDKLVTLVDMIIFGENSNVGRLKVRDFVKNNLEEIKKQLLKVDNETIAFIGKIVTKCRREINLD